MTWLIFGGTGQLGQTLQDQLKLANIEFSAPSRGVLDLTSEDQVAECIGSIKPSVLINCAAWTDVESAEFKEKDALKINGHAVEYLAKNAKKNNSMMVQISTDYVFSGDGDIPWTENDNPDPKTAYGRTKYFGEQVLQEIYPENSYIFRTAWLYSRYGKNFAKNISRRIQMKSETISVVGDQIGQPTLADDFSNQIILAVREKIFPGIYHGTNSGEASWFEFASEINSLIANNSGNIKRISSNEIYRIAKRPSYSVLGHEKWAKVGVPEMRNWKLALNNSIKGILKASINESH